MLYKEEIIQNKEIGDFKVSKMEEINLILKEDFMDFVHIKDFDFGSLVIQINNIIKLLLLIS